MIRRRRSADRELPTPLRSVVARRLAAWQLLDDDERLRLDGMVADFVSHTRWEGAGGLDVTDEMRATVAAHACLLVLDLDAAVFRSVGSVILYPHTVVSDRTRSLGGGIVAEGPLAIHGETRQGGPVVIVWSALDRESLHPELGRNVVFHEFAHQLDLHDGALDGTPPLRGRVDGATWASARDAVFRRVLGEGDPLLGSYAATNLGELFAVSTERFFTTPTDLRETHPRWYAVLAAAYRQDPAARLDRAGR